MLAAVKLPFLLHVVVETVAASSFILRPQTQLPPPPPPPPRPARGGSHEEDEGDRKQQQPHHPQLEERLLLKNLGGALIATNLIALTMALRDGFDGTSRLVALSLALYHPWPAYRAIVRLRRRGETAGGDTASLARRGTSAAAPAAPLGGPGVHLVTHAFCLVALLATAAFGDD